MSGKGIHVHGPHDHEIEHEAAKGGLGQQIAISMTLRQIAIALASITVLTKKTWLLWGAGLSALTGVATGIVAWF